MRVFDSHGGIGMLGGDNLAEILERTDPVLAAELRLRQVEAQRWFCLGLKLKQGEVLNLVRSRIAKLGGDADAWNELRELEKEIETLEG
jgi:hypothetical protein